MHRRDKTDPTTLRSCLSRLDRKNLESFVYNVAWGLGQITKRVTGDIKPPSLKDGRRWKGDRKKLKALYRQTTRECSAEIERFFCACELVAELDTDLAMAMLTIYGRVGGNNGILITAYAQYDLGRLARTLTRRIGGPTNLPQVRTKKSQQLARKIIHQQP